MITTNTVCKCGHPTLSHDMEMADHICLNPLCMCWDFDARPLIKKEKVIPEKELTKVV